MLTKNQIYQVLFDWLKAESGIAVIKVNPVAGPTGKAPRPARPYASLRFLNPSDRLGASVDQQSVTMPAKTVSTEGMRKAVASINIFGQNAIDTLAKVRDSLDRPDVIETFEAAGITHLEDSQINDLTELQETMYEERGQMDLTVAFVASSEVDVGTIEHAELDGTVNGRNIPITVN